MKTFLKISAVTLPLLFAMPSFAQVRWGVDLHFGTPPPQREVIVERPYPEAVWVPGYYNYYPGHRYSWNPGFWRRGEGHERFEGRREERGHFADRGRGHDEGRDRGDSHRGRIR